MTRTATLLLIAVGLAAPGCGQPVRGPHGNFVPEPGDLLFQDLDSGPLCDAIERVTTGFDGVDISHVGIVADTDSDDLVVIEAVSRGVVSTSLQTFLARSLDAEGRPKVAVGRLDAPHRQLIPSALRHARALVDAPYDKVFAIDNDAYYCSELIYAIFLRANRKRPVFVLRPMTFKDPETGEMLGAWERYFSRLGVPVPEGRAGINPGGISRAPVVTVIHVYGELGQSRLSEPRR